MSQAYETSYDGNTKYVYVPGGAGATPPPASGDPSSPGGGGNTGGSGSNPGGGNAGGGNTGGSGDGGGTGGSVIGIDPILTVGVGGDNGSGLSVNVLTPPDPTDTGGLNLNVIGDGDGQNLLDVGVLPGAGGLLPGLVPGLGGDGSDGPVGGLIGSDGLLGGLLGGGENGSIGIDPLLTVNPGGQDGTGLSLNVLAEPNASDTAGLNLNVLDTGDGQNLLDVGLLPGAGGLLPGLGGDGSNGPVGGLIGGDGLLGGLLNGGENGSIGIDPLLTVNPGGQDGTGLSVNVLAEPNADDTNALNLNLLDSGDGQHLLDVGLLPNDGGLGLPGLGGDGAGNPVGNLLGSDGLVGGLLGGLGGDGALLSGVVGNPGASPTGHLIDVDLGPESTNGLGLDLLSTPGADPNHTVSVNAIDVGPNGQQLLGLGALTGSGILDIPALGGSGTDGLTGSLLGSNGLIGGLLGGTGLAGGLLNGDVASGNTVSAPIDISALTDILTAPLGGEHGLLDLQGAHIL
ncbi:hypothetical protein RPMA_08365 [Tardiphaga alba]|uniref:Uncharacterized protein n=1 Tax=Tardiphaga alba TaxID=340268 RepID=A0ABX8A6I8_9BRAD|nr:hypothetical protein [Tardiphaga alba]QUS38842.1 hypothetical protein RPMA_08365 [Tardiphaga alba]